MRLTVLFMICAHTFSCSSNSPLTGGGETPTSALENLAPPITSEPAPADLNEDQEKRLKSVLPVKVREILENGSKFSLMTGDLEVRGFVPKGVARNLDRETRAKLLKSFYYDLVNDPVRAACFTPHHAIRAEHNGGTVEIDICFSCSNIIVRSSFGDFSGGLNYNDRKSEGLIDKIINEQGVEPKK